MQYIFGLWISNHRCAAGPGPERHGSAVRRARPPETPHLTPLSCMYKEACLRPRSVRLSFKFLTPCLVGCGCHLSPRYNPSFSVFGNRVLDLALIRPIISSMMETSQETADAGPNSVTDHAGRGGSDRHNLSLSGDLLICLLSHLDFPEAKELSCCARVACQFEL